jgi:hypothetical protein
MKNALSNRRWEMSRAIARAKVIAEAKLAEHTLSSKREAKYPK